MPDAFIRKPDGIIETSDWFLKSYQRCEHMAFLQSVLGIEPIGLPAGSPLDFGVNFHAALEALNKGEDWRPVVAAAYGEELNNFEGGSNNAHDLWGASFYYWLWEMLAAFEERWDAAVNFAEVRAELSFKQPVQHPDTMHAIEMMRHKGRADAIIRAETEFEWGDEHGIRMPVICSPGWWMYECKTASAISENYAAAVDVDDQVLMFAHNLEQEHGIRFEGILYDVMIKPPKAAHMMRQGEDDDQFAARKAATLKRAEAGELGAKLRQLSGESEEAYMAKQAKLKKKKKETDEEYEARQDAIEWKKPETDEEFAARRITAGKKHVDELQRIERTPADEMKSRLRAHFAKGKSFQRLVIPIRDGMIKMKLRDQYRRGLRIVGQVEHYEKTGDSSDFLRNWKQCVPVFGKCEFFELCKSGGSELVMDEGFRKRIDDEPQDIEGPTTLQVAMPVTMLRPDAKRRIHREPLPATMADVYRRSLLSARDDDDETF